MNKLSNYGYGYNNYNFYYLNPSKHDMLKMNIRNSICSRCLFFGRMRKYYEKSK